MVCFYQLSLLFSYRRVVRNGKSTAGQSALSPALTAVKHGNCSSLTPLQPGTHQKIIDMAMNGVGCRGNRPHYMLAPTRFFRHLKTSAVVGNLRIQPAVTSSVCAEMDEQWDTSQTAPALAVLSRDDRPGRRLLRTYSVNASMATLGSYEPAVTP